MDGSNGSEALRAAPILPASPSVPSPPRGASPFSLDEANAGTLKDEAVEGSLSSELRHSSFLVDHHSVPEHCISFVTYSSGVHALNGGHLKGLKPSAVLYKHVHGSEETTIKSIPAILEHKAFFLKMSHDNPLMVGQSLILYGKTSPGYFVRPFVLFPSLMKPPKWLLNGYENLSLGICFDPIEVDWGKLNALRGLIMSLTNGNEEIKGQSLHVWMSAVSYEPEERFEMLGAGSLGELLDRTFVPAFIISSQREPLDELCDSWIGSSNKVHEQEHESTLSVATDSEDTRKLKVTFSKIQGNKKVPRSWTEDTTPEKVTTVVIKNRNPQDVKSLINDPAFMIFLREKKVFYPLLKFLISHNLTDLVILLIQRSKKEMSFKALNYLIHAWTMDLLLSTERGFLHTAAASPNIRKSFDTSSHSKGVGDAIERFLLQYIIHQRNPMSSTASVIYALHEEKRECEDAARYLDPIIKRFTSLWQRLLDQLDDHPPSTLTQVSLHNVFYPSITPETVNDASPMATAFFIKNLDFVAHHLVTGYVKNQWKGRRYLIATRAKDEAALTTINPKYLYHIWGLLGFGRGPAGGFLLEPSMQLFHLTAYTSYAFFNSPRGRWVMNAVFELSYLTLFQLVILYPSALMIRQDILILLFVFSVGNMLDIICYLNLKYGGIDRLLRYLDDPWNSVNVLTNLTLLILSTIKLSEFNLKNPTSLAARDSAIHIAFSTCSVLMWVRTLGVLIPVYTRLGPLLGTVYRMIGAVIAFMFPFVVILGGFATMLSGVYRDRIAGYDDWTTSMLTLFKSMLGGYSFSDFQVDKQGNNFSTFSRLYGTIVLIVYLLLVAILLMNLLIAIIVERYKPDSVEAEASFKLAQIVDAYGLQVQYNYLPPPLNIAQYAFFFLPTWDRAPMVDGWNMRLGLINPDGPPIPDLHVVHPTGRGEVPYLLYLILIHPIILALSFCLYLLAFPLAVWQYARFRWGKFKKTSMMRSNKVAAEGPENSDSPVARNFFTRGARREEDAPMSAAQAPVPEVTWRSVLLHFPFMILMLVVGSLIYLILGAVLLFGWCGLVWWIWKVAFSLFNVFVRPFVQWSSEARMDAKRKRENQAQKGMKGGERAGVEVASRDLPDGEADADDSEAEAGNGVPDRGLERTSQTAAGIKWGRAVELVTATPYHEKLFNPHRVAEALDKSEYKEHFQDEGFLPRAASTTIRTFIGLAQPSLTSAAKVKRGGDEDLAQPQAEMEAQDPTPENPTPQAAANPKSKTKLKLPPQAPPKSHASASEALVKFKEQLTGAGKEERKD